MSLLDDARRLSEVEPIAESGHSGEMYCLVCKGWTPDHAPDCPYLALPQIVAALEATGAYIAELEEQGEHVDILKRIRAYQRMVAAFREGEVVPKDTQLTGTTS